MDIYSKENVSPPKKKTGFEPVFLLKHLPESGLFFL